MGVSFSAQGLSGGGVSLTGTRNYVYNMFDFIGDSRSAAINSGSGGTGTKSANHWFNVANALSGQKYELGLVLGISGYRTDQYINANLPTLLTGSGQWAVFDLGCINDLAAQPGGTFPFTNSNGVNVTQTNVGQIAAGNVIAAALQCLAVGKKVLLIEEIGSTSIVQASVGQMYDYNLRLQAFAEATPGVYIMSLGQILYNSTSSATAVAWKTGYMQSDGTHFQTLGAFFAGQYASTFLSTLVLQPDIAPSNINNVQATNARQLIQNPLFNTLTGGTANTINLVSGTVPNLWTVGGTSATSLTITSSADANGYGNQVTFALTFSTSDTVTIQSNAPSNSNWTLNDVLQGGVDATVAAGAVNASIYFDNAINTNLGTFDAWDLYAGATGPGSSTAYTYRFRSLPNSVLAGSTTIGFTVCKVLIKSTGSGSLTVTLSRPTFERRYLYSQSNATFTG